MDEVVVRGERPLVKVEQGRLSYDLQVAAQGKIAANAYEALTKLPGRERTRRGAHARPAPPV